MFAGYRPNAQFAVIRHDLSLKDVKGRQRRPTPRAQWRMKRDILSPPRHHPLGSTRHTELTRASDPANRISPSAGGERRAALPARPEGGRARRRAGHARPRLSRRIRDSCSLSTGTNSRAFSPPDPPVPDATARPSSLRHSEAPPVGLPARCAPSCGRVLSFILLGLAGCRLAWLGCVGAFDAGEGVARCE